MDEEKRKRIHEVARALKELNVVPSMEEAIARAKDIIANSQSDGKSLKELMGDIAGEAKEQNREADHIQKESDAARKELSAEARDEHKNTEHNIESAEESKAAAKKTEEQLAFDIKTHKLEKGDVEEAMREVDELECAEKDAEFIVKEAEKIQKQRNSTKENKK